MALVTTLEAAAWTGAAANDAFLPSLCDTASALVEAYCSFTFDPAAVPAPVKQACLEIVSFLWLNRSSNPAVAALSLGGGSVSFKSDAGSLSPLTPTVRALLAPYVVLALGSLS